jgi:hypothetical protein
LYGIFSKKWWITSCLIKKKKIVKNKIKKIKLVIGFNNFTSHFINNNAQCPPIDGLVVASGQNNLGRKIFGCTAQSPRSVFDYFGKTKISYFYITIGVVKNLFKKKRDLIKLLNKQKKNK